MLFKSRNQTFKSQSKPRPVKYRFGKEVLRMHKYMNDESFFDKDLNKITPGCYITMVLLSTGHFYTRRTKKKPTSSPINGKKNSGWHFENTTDDTVSTILETFRKQGWVVPRDYNLQNPTSRDSTKEKKIKVPNPEHLGPKITDALLKKLEKRDLLTQRSPFNKPSVEEAKQSKLDKVFEQDLQNFPKAKKPIPSLLDEKFWNLSLEKQKEELRKRGWDVK